MPLDPSYLNAVSPGGRRLAAPGFSYIPNARGSELSALAVEIVKATFTDALTADDDGVSAGHAGASSAGTRNQTIGGALATGGVATFDVARNVVITVTHATSAVAMSGTITGTDYYGRALTEAWSTAATGTSQVFTGKKAFKTVTSVTETIATSAAANTIKTGTGVVLGLPFKAAAVNLIAETQDRALPTTAGVIVAASTVSTADYLGTYAPNAAPDGAKDFSVWFLVEDFTVQP